MQRSAAFVVLMVIVSVAAFSGTARAQGFGVYEQSACVMARGGAGVAAPCQDASSVFFNPAGLSFDQRQIGLGAVLIGPQGDFTNSTTKNVSTLNKKWYPAPNDYVSMPIGKRLAVGFGVFAPYGLTTDWPTTSEGRFLGYKSLVQGVYLQPTVAYKVTDQLSIGVGVDITYLKVQLRQRADLSSQAFGSTTFAALGVKAGTDFADINLEGDAWHAGYHIGAMFKANDKLSFGARFLSGQKVNVKNGTITTTQISAVKADGTPYVLPISVPGVAPAGTPLDLIVKGQFTAPGKLANGQSTTTTLPLPAQFVIGVAYKATPKLLLLADYQYTRWSLFDKLPINGQYLVSAVDENYNDTNGIRLGAELSLGSKVVLRAGFDGHSAAAPDQTVTPNLPEGTRQEYTIGFGTKLTKALRFDAGYMYLHQPVRAGRTVPTGNNGEYDFKANLFSAAFSIVF